MIEWNKVITNQINMLNIMKADKKKISSILNRGIGKHEMYNQLISLESDIMNKRSEVSNAVLIKKYQLV